MNTNKRRYVLLDRDGVINRRLPGGCVTSWAQFEFLPRVLHALRLLAENGFAALVISNQAGVGKGLLSSKELNGITQRFLLETALSGGDIAQVYYCCHTTEERCGCRKPQPGLIARAQLEYDFNPEETFFVGDSPSDLRAAAAAGCPSIEIRRGAFLDPYPRGEAMALVASSLYEAAEMILERVIHHARKGVLVLH
jgi:D-glycero-D-manno-heptose 1,7-bisphosphate phosphatase